MKDAIMFWLAKGVVDTGYGVLVLIISIIIAFLIGFFSKK